MYLAIVFGARCDENVTECEVVDRGVVSVVALFMLLYLCSQKNRDLRPAKLSTRVAPG